MFQFFESRRTTIMIAAFACVGVIWIAGCTSEEPNPVGTGIPGDIEVAVPATKAIYEMVRAGHLKVTDEDVSYAANEVLYFGHSDTDSSSILLRYDLTTLPDSVPDWLELNDDTILGAELRLYRLKYYAPTLPDTSIDKDEEFDSHYRVYSLSEPLDVSLYPGLEPAFDALLIDQIDSGAEPSLDLNVGTVLDWMVEGSNGIIIREGIGSADGLIGFGSNNMNENAYGELERVEATTTIGITLAVTVYDELWGIGSEGQDSLFALVDSIFVFPSKNDVSTWHTQPHPSPDLAEDIVMQTHNRISPYFEFDLEELPEDVFINRAVIRLGFDFDRTVGQLQSLVIHQVPQSMIDGVESITLQALEDERVGSTGQYAVDYETMQAIESDWVGWDVTPTIQRIINGVLDPDFVFVLTAGETFSGYLATSAYTPDFYFSRYVFKGTDELLLRPHLELTYTNFSGGAQ